MLRWILTITGVILIGYAVLDNSGLLRIGKVYPAFIGYYTNLSNVLVWLYFILVLFNNIFGIFDFVNNPVVCFTVMMSITLTFLIYHFLLSGTDRRNYKEGKINWNPYGITNLTLHYFCPVITILFWLFCNDKSGLQVWHGLFWLISPALYIVYTVIRVKLGYVFDENGRRWPYDFMDVDKLGVKTVVRNLAVLGLIFMVLGLVMAFIGTLVG